MRVNLRFSIKTINDYPIRFKYKVKTEPVRSIIDFENFSPGFKKSTRAFSSDHLYSLKNNRCYKCFRASEITKGIIERNYYKIPSLEEKARENI